MIRRPEKNQTGNDGRPDAFVLVFGYALRPHDGIGKNLQNYIWIFHELIYFILEIIVFLIYA
ncbi:MAG TPA: hypothetical protein DD422_09345 [Akkermansia sp.]|nr:hypothetical protein [Akkermansia sp.]HBN18243.1 hypothetical protein [Akkermansia sp.]